MAEKKRRKFNECPNCRYRFTGVDNFCPNCGQENHNLNVPFSHVILEVLEGTIHFDTKVFRTLKLLLFKPGELTRLFADNKRASYVPPIRLYVFISFIFFLVLSADILNKGENVKYSKKASTNKQKGLVFSKSESIKQGPIAFQIEGLNSEDIRKASQLDDAGIDSVLRNNNLAVTNFNRSGMRKVSKFLASSDEQQTHKFLKMLSLMMFLLMPVFGLILKSAYFRRGGHYIKHLIFSIHYHCFVFIVLIISFLLDILTGWGSFVLIGWAVILLYLFLALYRLYAQSIGKTLLKTAYATLCYTFTLAVFAFIALALSIALT